MAITFSDQVNNEIYHELGEQWYHAKDNPVAMLRAESKTRDPWVIKEIHQAFSSGTVKILDVGCGAGFLSNELVQQGFEVTGIDASKQSLEVAKRYDLTGRAHYQLGDANHLPFPDQSFNVVCAMDFLEHVEQPNQVVQEIRRVLQPQGLFFFHTLNRNFLTWLIGIKGLEWFVKNTPPNLHTYRNLIKPTELSRYCKEAGMEVQKMRGSLPVICQSAFWKLLVTGRVEDNFKFRLIDFPLMGYLGVAKRIS